MYTIPAKAACPDCGTVVEDASGGIKTMELAGDLCTVDHPSPANPMCAHGCDYYDSCFPGTKPQGVAMYSAEGPEEHG